MSILPFKKDGNKPYTVVEDWETKGGARPSHGGLGGFIYGDTKEDCANGAKAYLKDYPYGGYMTEFGAAQRMPSGWRVRFFRSAGCE